MLPILGAVLAVSTVVAWAVSSDDDSDILTTSDRREREDEAREDAIEQRNKKIVKDIKKYKKMQIKHFSETYGVDIILETRMGCFYTTQLEKKTFLAYKIRVLPPQNKNTIFKSLNSIEEENKKLSQLMKYLKEMKSESAK